MTQRDRTYAAVLMFLTHVLAYADRQVMAVLLPAVQDHFALDYIRGSLLQGFAFSLFFVLAGLPLGRVADSYNRRNLLIVGIGLWSLATVACGLAGSFWQLFSARIAVGVGEACLAPAAASLLADYFKPAQRGRAIAAVQIGTPLGSLVALAGGGWLLTHLTNAGGGFFGLEPWQSVFVTLGAPGALIVALMFWMKEPERQETSAAISGAGRESIFSVLRRNPVALGTLFAVQTASTIMGYAILSWAPSIFIKIYGLTAAAAGGIIGVILVTCTITAYMISGWISDLLIRVRPKTGRVLIPGLALPFSFASLIWMVFATDVVGVTLSIALTMFVVGIVSAGAVPALQAIVPNRTRGEAMAVSTLVTNIMGLGLAPTLVAVGAQTLKGPYALQVSTALVCLVMVVVGLLLWWPLVRSYGRAHNYEVDDPGVTGASGP